MPIPKQVLTLIDTFARNIDAYKTGRYNETQVRREFIDPFFTALGWDVDNTVGYAEAYKDVIHEDAIKIGSALKAPDYCFRIGGTRKFFIEAKKPSIDIKGDPHPAFQLRRYAWSAKLGLSILTDFEEFAVYDCRIRPKKTDRASTARIKYIKYTEYAERWDEIESIFSRDAILKGSFDKYAQSTKRKRGTAEVDAAFLAEIERWREILAKNIALRNANLTNRELNFAVQKTIDRVIFLRIAEDRGLERYGELLGLCNGRDVYARLLGLFRKADDRYNSGLFHFQREKDRPEGPDELTPAIAVDDAVLKDIFKTLYYPDSPYEFSVLPAEILGHVYEQFLGKVITLTSAHRAKIEEKPEVKKAGGVYYTPAYIVDYIVENTVGKLLESRTVKHFKTRLPRMDPPLTVCDPACGSGSFLLGAYQYLLDWHLNYYTKNNPDQWLKSTNPPITQTTTTLPGPVRPPHAVSLPSTASPPVIPAKAGIQNQTAPPKAAQQNSKSQIVNSKSFKLTPHERKRILLDHIHGVDIDPQAVEVTKLSLLLRVLEGEKSQTLFATQRALPDLAQNIKCGNSLIAPDFYQNQQMLMFDEEQTLKINAFDWKTEFPNIFKKNKPGFDAVIGNPPWGATFSPLQQQYLRMLYSTAQGRMVDSYALFIEAAIRCLRNSGHLSFITPDTFLRKPDRIPLRRLLLDNTTIHDLVETGPVFSKVRDTWCLVFAISKDVPHLTSVIRHRKISRFVVSAEDRLNKFGLGEWDSESFIPQSTWAAANDLIVGYYALEALQSVISKIESYPTLSELSDRYTISRGEEGSKFNLAEDSNGNFTMVIPADIKQYYTGAGIQITEDSLTPTKLLQFYPRPKIWITRIQKLRWKQRIVCSLDYRLNSAGMKTLQLIVSAGDNLLHLQFLQGILASSLINFWCINYLADDMNKSYLQRIPIPPQSSDLSALVQTMLDLNKAFQSAKTPDEQTTLQRQITATDNQIDQLVYQLYNLTHEEIQIVEAATK